MAVKIIGSKRERSPAECLHAQERLILEMNRIRPYQKRRLGILRFKGWEDLNKFNRTRAAERL